MTNQPALFTESPEELARLRESLIAFYGPINSQERFAVERIAMAQQSVLRAARLETSLFTAQSADDLHALLRLEAFKVLMRYQSQAERLHRRAVQDFLALKAQRPVAAPDPPPALKPRLVAPQAALPPVIPICPAPAGVNLALRL
jgi:hypothetical protein